MVDPILRAEGRHGLEAGPGPPDPTLSAGMALGPVGNGIDPGAELQERGDRVEIPGTRVERQPAPQGSAAAQVEEALGSAGPLHAAARDVGVHRAFRRLASYRPR